MGSPDAAALPTESADAPSVERLDRVAAGRRVVVVEVDGKDDLGMRLVSVGLWPGAVVERIAAAPFGGPLLFRLHGYRLALRRTEAARVAVTERWDSVRVDAQVTR